MANSSIRDVWPYLVAAIACLANGAFGIKKGTVMFFHRTVVKSDDNFQFWTGVIFSIALGILGLAIYLPKIL